MTKPPTTEGPRKPLLERAPDGRFRTTGTVARLPRSSRVAIGRFFTGRQVRVTYSTQRSPDGAFELDGRLLTVARAVGGTLVDTLIIENDDGALVLSLATVLTIEGLTVWPLDPQEPPL